MSLFHVDEEVMPLVPGGAIADIRHIGRQVQIYGCQSPTRQSVAGVWSAAHGGSVGVTQSYGFMSTIGGWVEWDFFNPDPNLTVNLWTAFYKGYNAGVVRLFFDGVDQGTVDLYSSATGTYTGWYGNFGKRNRGKHTLRMVVDSKNAASSGSFLLVSHLCFYFT